MIKIINLSKHYNKRIIFENVNLEVPTGAFAVITGSSGVGKSTLLNLISGLEKPTAGDVIIDGKNTKNLTKKARVNFYRKTVGIIFQGSYMEPQLTLGENIALPGIFANLKAVERQEKVKTLAEKLGISERLEQLPREASGGEVGRAAIARALMLGPKIILADEPTANLDAKNSQNVLGVLKSLCQELNITVVVSSHDPAALNFATKTFVVENKTIREV